jgi:ubiquinone/menaquinone biosynthesis C-methylase UbiE
MNGETSKVLAEIEKLRAEGKITNEIYRRLKELTKRPVKIDLGEVFRRFGIFDSFLILDIGAGGNGTGPKVLGESVVALDISREEIDSARKERASARWVCADARKLPLQEQCFDFVVTFIGFAYIRGQENKLETLKEVHRVLKNNGLLVMVEPKIPEGTCDYMDCFVVYRNGRQLLETILGVSGGEIFLTEDLLEKLLNKAGFEANLEEKDRYFIVLGTKFSVI